MKVKSLGRQTDMIFSKFAGEIIDRGHYVVLRNPTNPGFHWGNYILFDKEPTKGDFEKWKAIFRKEFEFYKGDHHFTFSWDSLENKMGDYQEFVDNNFEFSTGSVLTASSLEVPPFFNKNVEIKQLISNQDWVDATNNQVNCAHAKFVNPHYLEFKQKQMTMYRKMTDAGMGHWYGAYLDDRMVGDLGIYHNETVGRYQNVGTHPEYRRQGICGTLVYEAGKKALAEYGIQTLVMEADVDYHAAKIYESVGFKPTEINYALSWWKDKPVTK